MSLSKVSNLRSNIICKPFRADLFIELNPELSANADTCCAPGYTAVRLANRSSSAGAFIFIADETPLHRKLGVYEDRG